MFTKILAPIDGRSPAREGLEIACALADGFGAKLVLLAVADPARGAAPAADYAEGVARPASYTAFVRRLPIDPALDAAEDPAAALYAQRFAADLAEGVARDARAFAEAQHVPEVLAIVRAGDPAEKILEVARAEAVDLIVLSTAGRRGLSRFVHPSVAETVQRRAGCQTLVLHPPGAG